MLTAADGCCNLRSKQACQSFNNFSSIILLPYIVFGKRKIHKELTHLFATHTVAHVAAFQTCRTSTAEVIVVFLLWQHHSHISCHASRAQALTVVFSCVYTHSVGHIGHNAIKGRCYCSVLCHVIHSFTHKLTRYFIICQVLQDLMRENVQRKNKEGKDQVKGGRIEM